MILYLSSTQHTNPVGFFTGWYDTERAKRPIKKNGGSFVLSNLFIYDMPISPIFSEVVRIGLPLWTVTKNLPKPSKNF
jgi:hypothetical protein